VAAVGDRQPELAEDVADVLVDGVVGDEQCGRDLNVFFQALLGGRLLRPAQLAEMTSTVPVSPEFEQIFPDARYGLGLFQRPLPCGGTYWSHGGGGAGYNTENGVTDDGRRSVVLSTSSILGHSLEDVLRQVHAADNLVAHALCGRLS
jgi:D-alanyl-D-alanine carboxypeptidase